MRKFTDGIARRTRGRGTVANAASSDAAQGVGAAYQQAAQLLQSMNIPFAQAEAATYQKLGELLQAQGQESRQDKKFSDLSASNLALALPVSVSELFRVCAQNEQAWREVA